MSLRRVAPSTAPVPVGQKLSENFGLFRHAFAVRRQRDWSPLFAELAEYDSLLRKYSDIDLTAARVLEIGFGAKPFRLVAMHSLGIDAFGIDAEIPLLRGNMRRLFEIYRRNGLERMLKTAVRAAISDRAQWRSLANEIKLRGGEPRIDSSRMMIGDAADLDLPPGSVDLVTSEDVFEHMERHSIERVLPRMASWLTANGLALIRPLIFTGISGGHLFEWYPFRVALKEPKLSEPWEHLRKKRYGANTSLNELTRADFRTLFSQHFIIEEEIVAQPDLGREHLTGEVERDLAEFPDEELFSNRVLFVLRPRS